MQNGKLTRREVLKMGVLASSGLVLDGILPSLSPAAAKSITVNCYGGSYEKALREHFVKCFKDKTGIEAEVTVGIPSAFLTKIRATRSKPDLDVFIGTATTSIEAIDQNLMDRIDATKVPNLKDMPKPFIDQWEGYGVSFSYGVGGIMYNKDKIKNPPQSWAEFVDRTIKGDFGKKVCFPSINQADGPICVWTIAQAFGGRVENPDIAFEKLKEMKLNIPKFYSDMSEVVNMMTTGEVDISYYYDGRAWTFHDTGNPWVGFIVPRHGGVFSSSQCMKVKNSAPEAWEFINCLLDPVAQSGFAKMLRYPMTNPKVKYPPEMVARLTPLEDIIYPPHREIMKRASSWVERWNKEIGG